MSSSEMTVEMSHWLWKSGSTQCDSSLNRVTPETLYWRGKKIKMRTKKKVPVQSLKVAKRCEKMLICP